MATRTRSTVVRHIPSTLGRDKWRPFAFAAGAALLLPPLMVTSASQSSSSLSPRSSTAAGAAAGLGLAAVGRPGRAVVGMAFAAAAPLATGAVFAADGEATGLVGRIGDDFPAGFVLAGGSKSKSISVSSSLPEKEEIKDELKGVRRCHATHASYVAVAAG